VSGPTIAVEDLSGFDISKSDLPAHYLADINGQVTLEATLAELENIGLNILAMVSGERLDLLREIGGDL
jgi:hypothetical protein